MRKGKRHWLSGQWRFWLIFNSTKSITEIPVAKDLFHEAVKIALQKDGWTITHDPYFLEALGTDIQIDLGPKS